MLKKYKFGFDFWGLLLFLVIMIPNFIWFAVPAPNDVLRADSVTPIIDGIGSICQVIFIAAICILKRKDIEAVKLSKLVISSIVLVAIYYLGWVFYYLGMVNPVVIMLLTLPPCLSFIVYTIDRKNMIATIPTVIFTICHIIYGVANFILQFSKMV